MGEAESSCSDTSFDLCSDVERKSEGSLSDFDMCDEFGGVDVCSVAETIKSAKAGTNSESESDEIKSNIGIEDLCNEENRIGNLEAQIEELLKVEKQMRLVGDVGGTIKAATDVLQLCFNARDSKMLNEQIILLSKRRGQFKQVVNAVVQQAMQYIDQTSDLDTKFDLIKTLNSMSDGKIHAGIERASFMKKLANIMEEHGLAVEAADLMQEVETIGSMANTERTAYIVNWLRRFCYGQSTSHYMRTNRDHLRHHLLPIQPRHQKLNKCQGRTYIVKR